MWEESLIFTFLYFGGCLLLPIKTPKKYLIVGVLAALLFFCIGLYGIHLSTRKIEPFSLALGGSCGGTTCSGTTPYCLVTEQALPDNTIDQTLTFNTKGQYVQILPPETGGDGVVQLSQILVYDSTGANLALNKPVTASCTQPNVLIGLPTADSSQLVQVPRTFARYVRIRPSNTSDGVMKIQQIMIMNKSGDNIATAALASVYSTTTTGGDVSSIINGTSTTPKPSAECWTSNKDTTYNAEYVEIDLGTAKPISRIEYVGPTDDTHNRILGLRFELSMYSLRNGGTNVIPNSLTVDGTVEKKVNDVVVPGVLVPRTDPSKVCMLGNGTRTAPVWEVDLGGAKFVTSVRYIGRADSGDDMNDNAQNSLPGPLRNAGVRFRVLPSKAEVATKGTCTEIPDLTDIVPYPTGTTPIEKIILKPYILKGVDLNKAKCILNAIQNNATLDTLIGCGLTELQVVQGFAKMKHKNLQRQNTGFNVSGSWLSGSKTITIVSGSDVPSVGMTIADTPTPVPSVLWSISGRTVTAVTGNTITIDKATTDTDSTSGTGGRVSFKVKLSDSDFARKVDEFKGAQIRQDIKFDMAECMRTFKKNNMQSIDTTPSPSSASPTSTSPSSVPTSVNQPTSQMDDGSKAATDMFVQFLTAKRRDPNATYSQSLTDPDLFTPITDAWAVTATGNLSSTTPVTDAQLDQAAAEFSVDRMTVPRSDMDNAAGITTSSYVPLTPGEASVREVKSEIFFVGGKFASREAAEKVCTDLNGTLATPLQLNGAWRRGAQWCDPGWVSMNPAQASDAKVAINLLIDQWNSGYNIKLDYYNSTKAGKRIFGDGTNGTGLYNPKDYSMFYDKNGEGFWLPLATTFSYAIPAPAGNSIISLSNVLRIYPWVKSCEVRYGYEPGWISRVFTEDEIIGFGGKLTINSPQFKAFFPSDPNPSSQYKYAELRIQKPIPGFDLKGYTSMQQMVDDLNMIGDIQAGLLLSTVVSYKRFPAQIPDTVPKLTKPKGLTAFICEPTQMCPSGYTKSTPTTPGQAIQCCKTYTPRGGTAYVQYSVNNNICYINGQFVPSTFYGNVININQQNMGEPVATFSIYSNCKCPNGFESVMDPPITSTTTYNTMAQIPVKCRSVAPCDPGYSPFLILNGNLAGRTSADYCVKDTCEPGYVEDAAGKCIKEYYKKCGTKREVVDKSSASGPVGVVCYGTKPSQYVSTVSLPKSDLTQTYQLNKTGRYVRIWPATKPNASVSYIESFQVGVDTTRNQITTPTNVTSPEPTVPPNITCKAGFEPVAVSNVNNNNPSYICVTKQCEPGYIKTNRGCVYQSWLSLSQIVIKDRAGNNISDGKPVYAFPPGSQADTDPKNLVNGNASVLSVLDANNGWLSPVYFDGEVDTFLQIDLQDNIEIGSVTIYGNTSSTGVNGTPPIMKGVRIEVSKSPRPLPFSNYRSVQVWHDMAAFANKPCPTDFYRKDCGDGLGPVCIIEGIGCPNDCPPGLIRDIDGQGGKPATYACIFDMHDLTNFQVLSKMGVVKSDFYDVNGAININAYNTALVAAFNSARNAWKVMMKMACLKLGWTSGSYDENACKAELARWIPNDLSSQLDKDPIYKEVCEIPGPQSDSGGVFNPGGY